MLQNIAKRRAALTSNGRRRLVGQAYGVSGRRISHVMGRFRSGLRYRRKRWPEEPALHKELKQLARRHPRYAYRRIHARLI